MRIALAGDFPLDPDKVRHGVEAVMLNLSRGLAGMPSFDVHVVTCSRGVEREVFRQEGNLKIHYLPEQRRFNHITFDLFDVLRIRNAIRSISPHLIHCHDPGRYSLAACGLACPRIVTISSLAREAFEFKSGPVDMLVRKYLALIRESVCLAAARNIIVISPHVRGYIARKTDARLFEIPNPVKPEYYGLPSAEEEGRILFAGRVTASKGVLWLLRSMVRVKESFPGIRLRIAGPLLEKEYRRRLVDFIGGNGLGENVVFLGLLNERELLEEYAKCSFFVLPSFRETFSMVAAQAMAAGKAVVAARAGGVPFLVKDGETGYLVAPGDIGQLASRMRELLNDRGTRLRFGMSGRKKAMEFSAGAVSMKTAAAYKAVRAAQ